jgi:glycosyltransferase involved in cell wall biosynthesis
MVEKGVKISLIIPVYNAELYLRKCLDSVITQKYQNWEAFIIDDASDDKSPEILDYFKKKDKRINVYRNNNNKGPGETRNLALSYATENKNTKSFSSEYIVFLDSDDWIEDDYFLSISEMAEKSYPDIIFIDLIQEKPNGEFIKYERMSSYNKSSQETIIRHQMTGKLPWGGVRKAVKKDLIVENNITYSNDIIGEEALYSFKLLYNAKKIKFIDKALYHYVIHSNSQSGSYNPNPYGPVCESLRFYLKEINAYKKYESSLISFAFTALIVSFYRNAQYHKFSESVNQSRLALKEYKKNYGFNLDKSSLEIRTRIVLPFIKLNLVVPIVLLAKVKAFLSN